MDRLFLAIKNVVNFKKTSRVIIVAAIALVAVLSVGFAVNRAADRPSTEQFLFCTSQFPEVILTDNIDGGQANSIIQTVVSKEGGIISDMLSDNEIAPGTVPNLPGAGVVYPEIIERNLDIITGSPGLHSSIVPYIQAHQAEYDEIVALGDVALAYIITKFEKGRQTDLRGWIMAFACYDIVGVDDAFQSSVAWTGQEWYDENKSIIMDMRPHVFTNGD